MDGVYMYITAMSITIAVFAYFIKTITHQRFEVSRGTRALSQNVTNSPEGTLTPNLKNVESTVQNKSHYCKKNPNKIQVSQSKKSINSKSMMLRVMVLVHHTSSMRFIYLWSFMFMPCIVLKLCSGKNQVWKSTKSINSKSMVPRAMSFMHCPSHEWGL